MIDCQRWLRNWSHAKLQQSPQSGGEPSGLAAKAVTTTIPIVCSLGGDAVKVGLVTQLNRPGGNITGVSILGAEMGPKRLELAHQLVPKATAFAVLINPKYSPGLAEARDMDVAAHSLGLQLTVLDASSESEIDRASSPSINWML